MRCSAKAYHSWSIDLAPRARLHKGECQGDNEGPTITHGMVSPLERFELLRVVLLEQGHIDIDRHCQVPQRISRHEHLDQKALELAQVRSLAGFDAGLGNHRGDIAEGVSPRSVEYESVDGFPEFRGGCKGHQDESGTHE